MVVVVVVVSITPPPSRLLPEDIQTGRILLQLLSSWMAGMGFQR